MASSNSTDFLIVPFKQVGPLKFGMTQAEVLAVLGEPERQTKTFTGRIAEFRKNISTKYKKDKLNEVSFLPGVEVKLDNTSIFNQEGINYLLENYDHESDLGFTVFPALGIAFTGFGKSKDSKTISVFTKAVLKDYLTT